MHTFYPVIKSYKTHQFSVDNVHTIHVEECGRPDGLPVLVLQDNFGLGCEPNLRRYFNPEIYRIILVDQRGCGHSTPHLELTNNDTAALIQDMELIRTQLQIDRWILFGGYWGSTLALLYAKQFPKQTLALIIYSVFLARKEDIEWIYHQGTNLFFPEQWQEFTNRNHFNESSQLFNYYLELLTGNNELARMAAAKNWGLWLGECATLQPHQNIIEKFSDPLHVLALAQISCHYLMNHCFIQENQILNGLSAIKKIPCTIIHGRYNMICPVKNAWTLRQYYPKAKLNLVREAGHDGGEPGMIGAIIQATEEMAIHLGFYQPTAC